MLFAAALMLSAVNAADDINNAASELQRAFESKEAISPQRRFNLAAMLVPSLENEANSEFWREAEHENEPPEHDPKYHEPMPTEAVRTEHQMPISTEAHPTE